MKFSPTSLLIFSFQLISSAALCYTGCENPIYTEENIYISFDDISHNITHLLEINEENRNNFSLDNSQSLTLSVKHFDLGIEICEENGSEVTFSVFRSKEKSSINAATVYPKTLLDGDINFSLFQNPDNTYTLAWEPEEIRQYNQCVADRDSLKKIAVDRHFKNGEVLKDSISGNVFEVKRGKIEVTKSETGLYLLSKVGGSHDKATDFKTAYYLIIDRFFNGDPKNDNAYGRFSDGQGEIGTFHGGDLDGAIKKLPYIKALGVNTVIINSPLEQVRGWVGGGSDGDFTHFGYHGFFTRDYRNIDKNLGSWKLLRRFVDEAHELNLNVLITIVANHPGHATLADMQADGFGSIKQDSRLPSNWTDWRPSEGENWHSASRFIDFTSEDWNLWWGPEWTRANLANYPRPGTDAETLQVLEHPDFITESTQRVYLPTFLNSEKNNDYKTVGQHLIDWHTELAYKSGADGFFIDAEKHLDKKFLHDLKKSIQIFYKDFVFVGENFGHQHNLDSPSFNRGHDGLLNYEFQNYLLNSTYLCLSNLEEIYERYASQKHTDRNFFHFSSWLDTELIQKKYDYDLLHHKATANALALAPGSIIVFYGDEVNRRFGETGSDPAQGTRSDMPWELSFNQNASLQYWKALLNFRKEHPAIAEGKHEMVSAFPYAFVRHTPTDKVLVIQY